MPTTVTLEQRSARAGLAVGLCICWLLLPPSPPTCPPRSSSLQKPWFQWTLLWEGKLIFSHHSSRLSAPSRDLPKHSTASSRIWPTFQLCFREEMGWNIYLSRAPSIRKAGWISLVTETLLFTWLPALLLVTSIAWTREVKLKFCSLCCYPATIWGTELCSTAGAWFSTDTFMVTAQPVPWSSSVGPRARQGHLASHRIPGAGMTALGAEGHGRAVRDRPCHSVWRFLIFCHINPNLNLIKKWQGKGWMDRVQLVTAH